MKRIYEFACENGHKVDRYVEYEQNIVQCDCGAEALRALSAPAFKLEGWSGSFPSAHAKFDRIHREKLKAEQKANS
ncbi:MAG: hypothetical protein ACO294_12915 [Methylococcales bacterium]|jgi:hypothetical protein